MGLETIPEWSILDTFVLLAAAIFATICVGVWRWAHKVSKLYNSRVSLEALRMSGLRNLFRWAAIQSLARFVCINAPAIASLTLASATVWWILYAMSPPPLVQNSDKGLETYHHAWCARWSSLGRSSNIDVNHCTRNSKIDGFDRLPNPSAYRWISHRNSVGFEVLCYSHRVNPAGGNGNRPASADGDIYCVRAELPHWCLTWWGGSDFVFQYRTPESVLAWHRLNPTARRHLLDPPEVEKARATRARMPAEACDVATWSFYQASKILSQLRE